jgi:hypothetical protein
VIGFSDEEFVGYTFAGSPPRRPRLWFLDRHVDVLLGTEGWTISGSGTWGDPDHVDIDVGTWTMVLECPVPGGERGGLHLRYQHHSDPPWTAVWRLTDVTIPHVWNFGRDDTWRLGLWPD